MNKLEFDTLSDEELDKKFTQMNFKPSRWAEKAKGNREKTQKSLRLENYLWDDLEKKAEDLGLNSSQDIIRLLVKMSYDQKIDINFK